ncbi:RHS repeat-associated core domain-containing protein [Nonomuraea sp. NPDC050451]|uniref:RHS repeat-associated core domain-containing protein n=1 Tax=Nonomuraea sp. NPDC050451 TaxID=3364364 RepID=UPI0037B4F47C
MTGVRQPSVGSQLANRDSNGQEFQSVSGNYTTTVVDASVATVGPALSIARTYNSLDARRDGLFGAGWSTRYDMRIQVETGASLLVTYPDGRRLRFAPKGDGTFYPPSGMHATLAEVSGGGWKLMDKSSTVYHFNGQGRLTRIVDGRGRAQELSYNADGTLAKVTAVGGRSLTFTWSGSHIASVSTDPVDGAPQTWTYTYDADKLSTACNPMPAPNCTTYRYTTGSLYRGLVEDDEPVGYWRLSEPSLQPNPTPTPTPNCTINPLLCVPQGTTQARSLGWGAESATYSGVDLEQPGALAGSTDTSAAFDGDALVQLPDNAIARLNDRLSLELWFKTTTSGILAYTSAERPSSSIPVFFQQGQPLLYVGTDGKLRGQFRTLDASGSPITSPITSSGAVNNGQWHHVVLSGAANNQSLYLDGAAVGSLAGTIDHDWMAYAAVGEGATHNWPATKPPTSDLYLTMWGLDGQIDEVALYDRALGSAEAAEHYAARLAAPHLLDKVTLPSGRVWAQNTYDTAKDRLQSHTDEHGGTWKPTEPSQVDPQTGTSTVTVTDPQNNTLTYKHDAWRGYRLISTVDQLEQQTSYSYDVGGYLSYAKNPNGISTNAEYDKRGNLLSAYQCQPATTGGNPSLRCAVEGGPLADIAGERWYQYYVNKDNEFDPRNDRLIAVRDGRSASSTDNTYAAALEYNSYGEQTKQTTPATLDFPNGRSSTVTYTDGTEAAVGGGTTPAGLVKTRTDAKGNATSFGYNAAGDLAEQADPSGLVTKFEHDALGRVSAQTQISDAEPGGVKSTFAYDKLGRLATQTAPGVKNEISGVTHTAKTSYTYDPDGNTLTATVTDLTGGDPARATTHTYDAYGHQETSTDPEGGVVRISWDKFGLPSTVTDQLGSVFGYTYTKRGELASRTLKNWTGSPVNPQPAKEIVLESFSYDPGGRLSARVDAMGRKTSHTYYADNRLAQVTGDDVKLNGSATTKDVVLEANTYDAAGYLTQKINGGGITTTDYVYDAAGRLASATLDPATLKRKTAYEYDANGLTTKETRTAAGTTRQEVVTYGYNAVGIMTRQTVENGDADLVTTWTVDDRGLITAITDPRGNADGATAADYTITNIYDALGRLIETKAPSVQIDKAGTATQGRPTSRIGYDTAGWQTHVVDPEGRLATSGFDKMGRRTSLTAMPYTPPGGTAATPTMGYGYDLAGRLIKTTDPRGQVTTTEYDALGNLVRVTDPPAAQGQPASTWVSEYDLAGEQLTVIGPTGARREATYDDLGRQITATQIERKPATAVYVSKMEYDDAGRLVKQIPHGSVNGSKDTVFTVNAAGEAETVTDPLSNKTRMEYDLAGRLVKTTDPNGNASTAEYDLAGRKTTVKDLTGASSGAGTVLRTYGQGYDLAGNPTSATSPEGHVTRQTFDALNRVTSLIEPVSASESITTSFGYDAAGARTRLTDGRGNATWTTYNSLGLVETVTEPATTAHPSAADRTWTHLYDQAGNATATLQPGGVRIDRTFDYLGRLTNETGQGGGAATAARTLGYDLAGRLTTAGDLSIDYNDRDLPLKILRGSTQETAYGYDALGNPTQRVDAAGTAAFTWDNASRLATATDPVTGRTLTYGYDPASRLKTITATSGQASTQSFDYDDLDRVTGQTLKNGSGTQLAKITYGWDKDDNLTTKTTAGTAGAGTNTYGYDHAGRLTSWTAPGGAVTTYEWDAAGNRTKAGNKTFTYDERNRLTNGDGTDYTYTPRGTLATSTKAGTTTNYTFDAFDRLIADGDSLCSYDALDRLASRITGAAKDVFAYTGLGNDLAAMRDSGGAVQTTYARDPSGGLLGLKEGAGAAVAALSDLHDDLIATYTTTLQTSTAYDPFGTVTAQTGTKTNLGYQGEYTDPDTGKVNMHARWYQPGTATFTSRDTATLNPSPSVQANRYTYANASPLTGTDPTGHATVIGGGSVAGPSAYTPGSLSPEVCKVLL